MQVKWTLTEVESRSIRKVFEDIPTNLCELVDCPDGDGDMCECCPMRQISDKWADMLNQAIHEDIMPLLKEIEPTPIATTKSSASPTRIGGQMVRKMIEAYEGK